MSLRLMSASSRLSTMKAVFALLLAIPASACSDKHLAACENAIRSTLKAPSSYKRISAEDVGTRTNRLIRIEYDASNSFGVPLRTKGDCIGSGPIDVGGAI